MSAFTNKLSKFALACWIHGMVNRRVSVNRQFDSHLALFGKNATNYPVQTAIGVAVGKMTPSMFSYGYSTYKRFTSNGKRF